MFSQATAYERFMGRWSRLLAPQLIRFAEVRKDDKVLDVGSGTGVLSQAVLDLAHAARVTGVDLSPEYVAYAEQMSTERRVSYLVGDAQQLPLPAASFDRTLSMLVLNFVPDRARALKDWKRVTRPRGLIAAAIWDYAEGMQMLRVFWDEAIATDPAIEPQDEAHMPLCRQGELGQLWKEAGLKQVQETALSVKLHFAGFDDYWEPFLLGQGPAGAYVAKLSKERQEKLRGRLRQRVLGAKADGAFEMGARAWAVKGEVSP